MSFLGASDGLVDEFSDDLKTSAISLQKKVQRGGWPAPPAPVRFQGKEPVGFFASTIYLPVVGNVPAPLFYGVLAIGAFLAYNKFIRKG